jgi:hypothetical protein
MISQRLYKQKKQNRKNATNMEDGLISISFFDFVS